MDQSTTPNLLHVTSNDGTDLAIDRSGSGPAVILACGGSVDRWSNAGLATELAPTFTVYNYDRRGRGDSGDTLPYAVEREIEDIAAVAAAAGGSAFLFGSSSGAALGLDAAAQLAEITKLAMWEPPYILEETARPPADTAKTFHDLVAAGRRGDAVEHFMANVVGLPPEFIEGMRQSPYWAASEALAHTLEYDATIMGSYALPTDVAASATAPTIVLDGSASFPFMAATADALARLLPNGTRATLEGQRHDVDAKALAPVVAGFFNG